MSKDHYQVEFRQDPETRGWTATMPDEPAVVTQGKTLKEAHERVRSALELVRRDARGAVLHGYTVWDSNADMPADVMEAVKVETNLRVTSLEMGVQLERATEEAVKMLISRQKLTYRAAGDLLGITHQRVEQIAKLSGIE